MLTPELVRARRKGDELSLVPLKPAERRSALELCETLISLTQANVGERRDEVRLAWQAVPHEARHRRLLDGLTKLVEDRCEFEASGDLEPVALRREIFERSTAAWRSLSAGQSFERVQVIAEVAAAHGVTPDKIEASLYGDLKAEQRLVKACLPKPEHLLADYELGQVQAVLLRATELQVDVACASPSAYRELFRKLKFRRLLFRIEPAAQGYGYRLVVDGPYSLFESVTKYGLQLALVLPAFFETDGFRLRAEVKWGKERRPLKFRLDYGTQVDKPERSTVRKSTPTTSAPVETRLPEEVERLMRAFEKLDSGFRVAPSTAILNLPGVGVCVPDLVFEDTRGKQRIYFEALGFWSREAVWRRVELAQRGLGEKMLFAVSSRLRVSREVLEEQDNAALYVYKGTLSASAVLRHLQALAG